MADVSAWRVEISPTVFRYLDRIPAHDRERITNAILRLQAGPNSGDVKRLKGRAGSRLRIGKYRALLLIDSVSKLIHVEQVGPRGDIYK